VRAEEDVPGAVLAGQCGHDGVGREITHRQTTAGAGRQRQWRIAENGHWEGGEGDALISLPDHQADLRLMAAWSTQVHAAGLPRGDSFDLDFHTVPANTQEEPLEKHYVSSRSRRQQGILVFLARDATERVLCYGNAGLSKAEQPDEILRFVEFWQARTGKPPAELVFDSQLTTYTHLHQLNQLGIGFMTLRRRSKKMLEIGRAHV
jgi:hypothetical protein